MIRSTLRYESFTAAPPTRMDSSTAVVCSAVASASLWMPTVFTPSLLHVRAMRAAISPRFAIKTLSNIEEKHTQRPRRFEPSFSAARLQSHRCKPAMSGGVHGENHQ
jgi:hypothetical protein